jgi:pimeloyl-ACP methyl ester carboxylesterase
MPSRIPPRPGRWNTLRDYTALRPQKKLTPDSVRFCPPGDGSPVLVLPGILRTDRQTARFRDGLTMLGYVPFGWELGTNWGPKSRLVEGVTARLGALAKEHGPVRLVGFSMGGLFARFLAHARPPMVSQVITVCSPFRDPLDSAWLPLRPLVGAWPGVDIAAMSFMVRQTPPVPWAALYSQLDGVVAWRNCQDPAAPTHCFEVRCRHKFAPVEEQVFRQVATCLAPYP